MVIGAQCVCVRESLSTALYLQQCATSGRRHSTPGPLNHSASSAFAFAFARSFFAQGQTMST